jgi:glycosyltransferase involved in cell wall biosynthesis
MFSVLIPVFNHARFLRRAVESALRDRLVGEVLVVDDGSHDDSPRVIRDLAGLYGPRVRDINAGRPGNRGAHARLNELVEAARHDWVAVLNSDDAFVPSRFVAARALARFGRTQFVSGNLLIMDAAGTVCGRKRGWLDPEYPFPPTLHGDAASTSGDWRKPEWQEAFRARLLHQNFIATTSNMLFTKQLHARIGGFRDYRYCHDWDFALRAAFDGDVGWCDQYLTLYRIHGSNTISEAREAIVAEVRRMFHGFRADIGGIEASPRGRTGLTENRYLSAA